MNSFHSSLLFRKKASEQKDLSFSPDYSPQQLSEMGVYEEVYDRTKPRLASLNSWPEHWFHPEDKMGWLEWYKKYNSGRRMEDDKRQIKRWIAFKSRHGGKAFQENPTPRRAYALRNWAVDPTKLVKDPQALKLVMDEYKEKQYSKSMDKVSFLLKVAKDEKPGLWANIRAKKRRGEKPAKSGDKDFPNKEQWNKLTKQSSDVSFLPKLAKSPIWQILKRQKIAADLATTVPNETPENLYNRIVSRKVNVDQFFNNATKHNWDIPGVPGFLARTVARRAEKNPDPYLKSLVDKVPKNTVIDVIKRNPDAFKNVSNKITGANNVA